MADKNTGVDLILNNLLTNYGLLGLLLILCAFVVWFIHSLYLKSEKALKEERINSHDREKEQNTTKLEDIKSQNSLQQALMLLTERIKP